MIKSHLAPGLIVKKDTTQQTITDSRDERMKIHQVLFCTVVPFIMIAAAVSVVAITVFIDKNNNHSKANIHDITYKSTNFNNITVRRGNSQTGGAVRPWHRNDLKSSSQSQIRFTLSFSFW